MFYASPLFLKTLSNIDSMIYDIINDDISDENVVNTLNESHATFWNNHDETHDYHRSISVYVSCINQVLGSDNCVDYIWDEKTAKKFVNNIKKLKDLIAKLKSDHFSIDANNEWVNRQHFENILYHNQDAQIIRMNLSFKTSYKRKIELQQFESNIADFVEFIEKLNANDEKLRGYVWRAVNTRKGVIIKLMAVTTNDHEYINQLVEALDSHWKKLTQFNARTKRIDFSKINQILQRISKVKGNERMMLLTSIAELENQFKKFFDDINAVVFEDEVLYSSPKFFKTCGIG